MGMGDFSLTRPDLGLRICACILAQSDGFSAKLY